MSDQTLRAVEEAIEAHFADDIKRHNAEMLNPDPERQRDMVVDWIVGYTISGVVDVDGKDIVGYRNMAIIPPTNPNAHVGLSMWLAEEMGDILHPDEDDS
jgi:hypothetical protein